jgi:hypothetical protein
MTKLNSLVQYFTSMNWSIYSSLYRDISINIAIRLRYEGQKNRYSIPGQSWFSPRLSVHRRFGSHTVCCAIGIGTNVGPVQRSLWWTLTPIWVPHSLPCNGTGSSFSSSNPTTGNTSQWCAILPKITKQYAPLRHCNRGAWLINRLSYILPLTAITMFSTTTTTTTTTTATITNSNNTRIILIIHIHTYILKF